MISHVWKNGDEYCVDTAADLYAWDVTDIDMGTKAYVIETGKRMILNGNKEWKEFYGAGGGSGSGGSDGGETSSGPFLVNFTAEMSGQYNEKVVATLVDDVSLKEITDHIAAGDILFVVKPLWPFPTPAETMHYFRPCVVDYMPDGGNVSSFWCVNHTDDFSSASKEIRGYKFCYGNETYTIEYFYINLTSN